MSDQQICIHDQTTVGDLIQALHRFDPRQHFMTQAILPDGSAFNAPATIFEILGSNCGDDLKYLGLQIRCDQPEK